MQPRFTIQARPAASSTTISSAVRPDGNDSVTVRSHSGRLSGARFWKNASPAAPFTKRLRAIGRPPAPVSAPGRHGEVVADEVELRRPDRLEEDLARVRDHDLAVAEPEDLLLLRHARMLACCRFPPAPFVDPVTAASGRRSWRRPDAYLVLIYSEEPTDGRPTRRRSSA